MSAGRRRALALIVGLITLGPPGHAACAQPTRLVKIGALTESWGPTPAIIGLRERHGFPAFDDPVGDRPNVFLLIREALS